MRAVCDDRAATCYGRSYGSSLGPLSRSSGRRRGRGDGAAAMAQARPGRARPLQLPASSHVGEGDQTPEKLGRVGCEPRGHATRRPWHGVSRHSREGAERVWREPHSSNVRERVLGAQSGPPAPTPALLELRQEGRLGGLRARPPTLWDAPSLWARRGGVRPRAARALGARCPACPFHRGGGGVPKALGDVAADRLSTDRRPVKLTPAIAKHIVRRLVVLRKRGPCSATTLQADLARTKGVALDVSKVRQGRTRATVTIGATSRSLAAAAPQGSHAAEKGRLAARSWPHLATSPCCPGRAGPRRSPCSRVQVAPSHEAAGVHGRRAGGATGVRPEHRGPHPRAVQGVDPHVHGRRGFDAATA